MVDAVEEENKVGSPWSVLPIKNNKYAKDLLDVHLSDRGLTSLEKFEQFPNLEVIWLNNNQLHNLDDISQNFRVKQIYAQANSLNNIEGIKKFKFLNVLLISNNQLRDLDDFLEFLSKFAFLEQLDLFGNPLAEEPDYRLKIIHTMPQIQILDRHKVTLIERQKAAKLAELQKQANGGSKNASPVKAGKKDKQKVWKGEDKMKGFSLGEKDLYKNVGTIKAKIAETQRAEEEKTKAYFENKMHYEGIPIPTKKLENKMKFGQNTEDELVEWEKNQVKPLYREFDGEKKGVTKEELCQIMKRLATDECIIGKVPNVDESEYAGLFEKWDTNEDGKVSWEEFREGMNKWKWRMVDRETLEEVINDFFAQSYKFKMQGKDAESKEMATKALRLQGSLTKTKPIETAKKSDDGAFKRGDQFVRTIHRRVNDMPPEESFGKACNVDRTMTHTFRC